MLQWVWGGGHHHVLLSLWRAAPLHSNEQDGVWRSKLVSKLNFFLTTRLSKCLKNITELIKVHICFIKRPHIHPSYPSILSPSTFLHLIRCLHACVTVQINWANFTSFQGKRKTSRSGFLIWYPVLLHLKVTFAEQILIQLWTGDIRNKMGAMRTKYTVICIHRLEMTERMIVAWGVKNFILGDTWFHGWTLKQHHSVC